MDRIEAYTRLSRLLKNREDFPFSSREAFEEIGAIVAGLEGECPSPSSEWMGHTAAESQVMSGMSHLSDAQEIIWPDSVEGRPIPYEVNLLNDAKQILLEVLEVLRKGGI